MKIHVSESTKAILDNFGTFCLELRGEVELKGKGAVTSYWLLRSSEADPRPTTPVKTQTENEAPFPLLFPAIAK